MTMNNQQILDQVKKIKNSSFAYQKIFGKNHAIVDDEIGGHVKYDLSETKDNICPSDDFIIDLFKECSTGLGFEYER